MMMLFIWLDKPSFLDLQNIRDITVRAGKDFEVHIPYKATPKAQAQWIVNDQDLLADDRINSKVNQIKTRRISNSILYF